MLELNSLFNNRYKIERYIGKGGMADVYKAYDKFHKDYCAIKICREDVADKEEMYQRFVYEIKLTSEIQDHFNIVRIIDYGKSEDGLPFMVTEYLSGQTLRDTIDIRRNLSLEETCNIMCQLLDGLSELHSRNIIHRDIKPQNVYLMPDATVKIADFGISCLISDLPKVHTDSRIVGTPQYMAPESAMKNKYSILTDIYAAGITFYELLVGNVPFNGESPTEILKKQCNEPLPDVSMYKTYIPKELNDIVQKACAKKEKNRYQSDLEFKNDIINLLKDKKKLRTQNFFERLLGLKGK